MRRRPAERGAALAAATAAIGALAWAVLVEPRRLRVRRETLWLGRWPPAWDGLRLALVSDLHTGAAHATLERIDRVAAVVAAIEPDLVALLGDYVDAEALLAAPVDASAVARRLAVMRGRLGTFAVLGNHDWSSAGHEMPVALHGAGVRVLEDEAVRVASTPAELWVAGLGDASERSPDVGRALAAVPEDAAVLLLSHDPDPFPFVPERVALTVSGHTHGGQVDLPLLRRRMIPSRFGDRYAAGHVVEAGRHLFVSRGIGTSAFPVRFGATPEVVVLTLRTAGGPVRRRAPRTSSRGRGSCRTRA